MQNFNANVNSHMDRQMDGQMEEWTSDECYISLGIYAGGINIETTCRVHMLDGRTAPRTAAMDMFR